MLRRLTHTERDIASKRSLIENYKSKLSELETNGNRVNDKSTSEVRHLVINIDRFVYLNRTMKND